MAIGERDFVGAAGLLAALRSSHRGGPDMERQDIDAIPPEVVLEQLARLKVATAARLASQFSEKAEAIGPQIEKLIELGLVESRPEGGQTAFILSKVGKRARKFARIAQSGS